MKFSEHWLREWVSPDVSSAELAEQLTMAGLEVDGIEMAALAFSGIVIGEVMQVDTHPEADRLHLCKVDVGEPEWLDIVCGASNVAPGIRVPTAKVGAVLPGGLTIKKAKLRGAPSHGMLCSSSELGLSDSADGLMLLPQDAPKGMDIRQYLNLDDQIIDVDFTPNRGDCLSVMGIAREIAVLNDSQLKAPVYHPVLPQIDDIFPVRVVATQDCPRYLGRVIRNIDNHAVTPIWMQERLRRAGLRSLNPCVDVTNYVLLEYGQPMHAFDLQKLSTEIVVRRAQPAESVTLLDGSTVTLNPDVLVIADAQQAHAFAGVMGGLNSAVEADTAQIFLECAFFSPESIRGKGRQFGIQTDSSYRFERGVDYCLQHHAMERATELLLEIVGGQAGPVQAVVSEPDLPVREAIQLRLARVKRVLGVEFPTEKAAAILKNLGMQVSAYSQGLTVIPPSYRFDISIEVDLIEELARIYGYQQIPAQLPVTDLTMTPRAEARVTVRRIKALLVGRGYSEAITYSFVDPAIQALLDPGQLTCQLANPISAEMSVMRTTLWASLLKALSHNQHRQQLQLSLFECGMRFQMDAAGQVQQETMIAGAVSGDQLHEQWGSVRRSVDFFDVKSDVEAILGLTGCDHEFVFKAAKRVALHPGQSAQIIRNDEVVGWLGTLHPEIGRQLDLSANIIVFELNYALLSVGRIASFRPISKFPSIRRDLALVVDESVSSAQLCDQIMQASDERVKDLVIFDVYQGKGIPQGKKSLALALTIQDDNQTLRDDQVEELVNGILVSVQKTSGACLRE